MSTRIMGLCWPLSMRPPPKAVLIALADMANDEGFCWPSIDRICERTCYGRTTVIEAIAWLESAGIVRANRTNGRKTTYWVEPEKFAADAASEPSVAPQNQSAARTGPPRVPVRHADPTSPPRGRVPVRHADTNRHLTVKETKPPIPPAVAGGEHVRRADPPKPGGHAAPDMAVFEALVAVYPRRKAQERARRQWVALAPDPALQQRILAAATAQAHGPEWLRLKAEGREHLIPMLSSWLHGRRWTDEVSAPPSSAGSARAWDETADGIVAMGVKLGLPPWDRKAFEAGRGEQFPVYAARVRNALRKMETGHAH